MAQSIHPVWLFSSLMLLRLLLPEVAQAQVSADGTLSTTVTSADPRNFVIEQGDRAGGNLFHSFRQFSVPTGGSAHFNNAADVQNIFARVTGSNVSSIDGLIRANGTANLFLLNPSGILFGPNAQLNLGGSFVGTTARNIRFADGIRFGVSGSTGTPLLTVSAPVGLQLGQNPRAITVQGSGHQTIVTAFLPFDRRNNPVGLQVGADHTLALIGGQVNFVGGIVTAGGGGHLELGSVSQGQVGLQSTAQGWSGDYSAVQRFNDIHLARQSLLDASGFGGSIQLQGRNIRLSEASLALVQRFGGAPADIQVHATESLDLVGNTPDGKLSSAISAQDLGMGRGGDVTVSAGQITIRDGGRIGSQTYTGEPGGNVHIQANDLLMDGYMPQSPASISTIGTASFGAGNAGDLAIATNRLTILNGANIISVALNTGQAGNIRVNARDQMALIGANPFVLTGSAIVSSTFGAGDGGNIFVNTSRLILREGGTISAGTSAQGSSGNVAINATDSVTIEGKGDGAYNSSGIAASALIAERVTQQILGLPPIPTGNSGSVTINTPSLYATDKARITVQNEGPGRAGNIQINANVIRFSNQSRITASTASGNGGNIRLNSQESLLLNHGSNISATAAGIGDGGNISIRSPVILGLENSDIIANAVKGRGGNIGITTQGLFGFEYRDRLTADNDITASSEFGVNGTVDISTPGIEPNARLLELPENFMDSSQQVAQTCAATSASRFVATGRGGIPENPTQELSSDRTWNDIRDLSAFQPQAQSTDISLETRPTLVEATGWRVNAQGRVELQAANPASNPADLTRVPATCAARS